MERKVKRFLPPAFFAMLAVSFVMWWLTQLSKEYGGVEVPVEVKVEGNIFTVRCAARGTGFRLMSHRIFKNMSVDIPFAQLNVQHAPGREHHGVINSESLKNALAVRVHDITIESVGAVPEITLVGR